MDLCSQNLKAFYGEYKTLLEKNYPGMTWEYLLRELSDCDNIVFEELKKGVPLGYITGKSFFYHSEFLVDSCCLIPRFETELLVQMAVDFLTKMRESRPRVIDVGTGCGAIILSVLRASHFPLRAFASDISKEVLKCARLNYYRLEYTIDPSSCCDFICTDRLKAVDGEFDLILSNPPYIKKRGDQSGVHPMVLAHGPSLALFLDDDEYENWFREFFQQIFLKLSRNGQLIMEGHENHLKPLARIAKAEGLLQIEIKQDLTGRDRFLIAKK